MTKSVPRTLSEVNNHAEFHRCDVEHGDSNTPEVLNELGQIIRRRVERSFAFVVPLRQYHQMNKEFLLAEIVGWPFPMAAWLCMGKVDEWAEYHEIHTPVLKVVERGSKHAGQLEWIMCRDQLPMPDFKGKDFVPVQVADFIAGEIAAHLPLPRHVMTFKPSKCLEQIWPTLHNGWHDVKLHVMPTAFDLPRRDPRLKYHSKIVRVGGERRALVQCWPKTQGHTPKVKKKLLQALPHPVLTSEIAEERLLKISGTMPDETVIQSRH